VGRSQGLNCQLGPLMLVSVMPPKRTSGSGKLTLKENREILLVWLGVIAGTFATRLLGYLADLFAPSVSLGYSKVVMVMVELSLFLVLTLVAVLVPTKYILSRARQKS
jgi:uncharacterized membrane protein YedE/YeeE